MDPSSEASTRYMHKKRGNYLDATDGQPGGVGLFDWFFVAVSVHSIQPARGVSRRQPLVPDTNLFLVHHQLNPFPKKPQV